MSEKKDKEKRPKQEIQKDIPLFPSASILLASARDEYTKEIERAERLDSKASFFMSAIILVATIFMPNIPFEKLIDSFRNGSCCSRMIIALLCCGLVTSFVFLFVAFKRLYESYKLKKFKRFETKNITDDNYLEGEPGIVERTLCLHYVGIIEKNSDRNEGKAKLIGKGLKASAIGFLLLTLFTISLRLIV